MFGGPRALSIAPLLMAAVAAGGWGVAGGIRAAEQPVGNFDGRNLDGRGPSAGTSDIAPSNPSPERIAALIKQLGARTFSARQRAQKALVALGVPAKAALEAATDDSDWEVRSRARQALEAVLEIEFEAHLNAFLSDETVDAAEWLAGWERFSAVVGDTPAARRLFGEMQRAERGLLEADADSPEHASRLLDQRAAHFGLQMDGTPAPHQPRIPVGSTAAMVFVASNPDVSVSDNAGYTIDRLALQRSFFDAMQTRPMADPLRKLLTALVSRAFDADSLTAYYNIDVALRYDLKEIVGPSQQLLAGAQVAAFRLRYPILALGKFGSAEQVPVIEPLLNDARSVNVPGRGQDSTTEVRDVALAALVHLTGQNLADYGFAHAKTDPVQLFQVDSLGFHDAAAREAAMKKWREWSLRHKALKPSP
jgi:HEAT repeat protein